jgi:hypothetical protein
MRNCAHSSEVEAIFPDLDHGAPAMLVSQIAQTDPAAGDSNPALRVQCSPCGFSPVFLCVPPVVKPFLLDCNPIQVNRQHFP